MPTVDIKRKLLLERLGKDDKFSQRAFADLCFDFGIELDEVTSEYKQILHERGGSLTEKQKKNQKQLFKLIPELKTASKEELYKIDVPANRYDLLCVEGLTRALRIFENVQKHPNYTILEPDDEKSMITFNVKKENVDKIRPFAVGAVLRDIDLDDEIRFNSFIKLQEKLHFNICRKRQLVAIGTHDLDTVQPPFLYDARSPDDITFCALKEAKARTARELFAWYKSKDYQDASGNVICAVRDYLHLIEDSPVFPIIYDSNNVVLSMPPIINSEHSKISRKTTNIFIDVTANDLTKANIVLNTLVCMFSEYCAKPFTVEPVRMVYEGGDTMVVPNFDSHLFETSVDYINTNLGTTLSSQKMVELLYKMGLHVDVKDEVLSVQAPPTRSDILHPVDIVEDVAIAFGYNNLEFRIPERATTGKEFVLNSMSDKIRECVAMCGFTEVLNWALISRKETFDYMLIDEATKQHMAVYLDKPKATQFEMCRINMLPGIFKTLSANIGQKNVSLPLRLFEVGDVVFHEKDSKIYEVDARNERRLAAIIVNRQQSGLEQIHGLLDHIMEQHVLTFLPQIVLQKQYNGNWPGDQGGKRYYSIRESEVPSFFPKRQAEVLVDGKRVGYFGIIHPKVLRNFAISTVTPVIVSALEINLECFVKMQPLSNYNKK